MATYSAANIQAALDEAGKVVKKQKTCADKSSALVDQVEGLVRAAIAQLEAGMDVDSEEVSRVAAELHKQLEEAGCVKELNSLTKELHGAVGKLGKALEKAFDLEADVCRAMRPVPAGCAKTLSQILAEHFYREGRFDLGDLLAAEAQLPNPESLKGPYSAMHAILTQVRAHNLDPALQWAIEHRPQLDPDGGPSAFEFKLHSLNFINTLTTAGRARALAYAKQHFPAHQHSHIKEIQRLMGCMLFVDRPAAANPYAELLSANGWEDAAQEFAKQACSLLGQSHESPLAVVVAAGCVALPALLKLAAVMEKNLQDLRTVEHLPVEIELGREFVFHSIFACPVSRDMCGPENPPMLLPCNHVLAEQSVAKLVKNRNRTFKCPYCPMEARFESLKPLKFPDI